MMLTPDAKWSERILALQHGSHPLQMEWQHEPTQTHPSPELRLKGSCNMHTLLTQSHGSLKASSFRESSMRLFATYRNFKFVNRQIIDPCTEKKMQYKSPCYLN